ncbi:MAG: nucleotidyltransferase family protein [Pseudomonadota bacterium]
MTWTHEDRLLLYCCQKKIHDEVQSDIADILGGIDWRIFLKKARKEGVSPLVFLRFSETVGDSSAVPPGVIEELKKDYYATAARNAVIFEALRGILKTFNHAGVDTVVLKGAALAELAYRNLALRSMSDVDLLIKKEDIYNVDLILKGRGYYSPDAQGIDLSAVRSDYLTSLAYISSSENYPCFHIHWHFVNSTIPNDSLIKNIPMANIWHDADKARIAGVDTLVMAPHHLLIHLAEHSLRVSHSLSKFCFLCDINEAVESYGETIDWERLIIESRRFSLGWLVYLPLYFAVKFLNTKIPNEVLLRLRPERLSLYEKIFIKLVSENCRFSGLSYLLHLSSNKGVTGKARFILRTLFPPGHVIAQRCGISPDKVGLIFYLRRMNEVFMAFAKSVQKILGTVS